MVPAETRVVCGQKNINTSVDTAQSCEDVATRRTICRSKGEAS